MRFVHRCDGGPGVLGMGHIVRNSALAEELRRRGHDVSFRLKQMDGTAGAFLSEEQFRVTLLSDSVSHDDEVGASEEPDVIIIDLYPEFGGTEALYRAARRAWKVFAFSDYALPFFMDVDAILNPHPGAENLPYDVPRDAVRLFGLQYLILRRQFRNLLPRSYASVVRNVLVTFGGADARNCTQTVAEAFRMLSGLQVTFVLGPSYSREMEESLARFLRSAPYPSTVVRNARDMADRMIQADLAVAAAGSTVYELCATGTPALVITTEENQRGIAESLARMGVICHMGRASELSPGHIGEMAGAFLHDPGFCQTMGSRAKKLIDGRGVERVADIIEKLAMP